MGTQVLDKKVGTKAVFSGVMMKKIQDTIKYHRISADRLNHVQIEVSDNKMTVIHLRDNLSIRKELDLIEGVDGVFMFPIDTIRKTTHVRNDSMYSIEADGEDKLRYNNDGEIQIVKTLPHKEHFTFTEVGELTEIGELSYDDWKSLRSAIITASKMEERPILQAVLLRGDHMYSTDAHRLYSNTLDSIDTDDDVILHSDFVRFFLGNEGGRHFKATVSQNKDFVVINTDDSMYVQKVVEGNYPDLSRLIPKDYNSIFTILDQKKLKEVVEKVYELSKEELNSPLRLEVESRNMITISTIGLEEDYKQEIEISSEQVEVGLTIRFNSMFLLNALRQLDTRNSVEFHVKGGLRPFIVRDQDKSNNAITLLLPIRVS